MGDFNMTRAMAAAALMALGLTGCMSGGDFAERAVEHNRAIAMAADEIALLNIVRAAKDRPVVYSQFRGVSESFSNDAGLSLSVPFGADAGNFYNSELSVGPNQYVSLTTAPLDDVEFYNGVMRPVQVSLLRYYLDNGWPRDLLLSLTVEKLVISEGFYARVVAESNAACAAGQGGLACERIADASRHRAPPAARRGLLTFTNDPRSPELFDAFHDLVLRLIVLDLTIDGAYAPSQVRVPVAAVGLELSGDEIAKLQAASATIERKGSDYVITTYSWVPGLKLAGLGNTTVNVEGQSTNTADVDMTASLRSPDSILFYLGAYVREGGADADVLIGGPGSERFVPVMELGGCSNAIVTVDLEGECYGIPDEGISMKVIAFLHQVFGLNKQAAEPPSPGVVRAVK
jgi:hypothetical protein